MTEPVRTIRVDSLARVEGEGGLLVRVRNGRIEDLQFRIHEPPRFFEGILRGRRYDEVPDITARICGICPVAYLLGASQAMEQAAGVRVEGGLRDLRRLLYCGEWIASHALHVFMLHLPDFLGLEDSFQLTRERPGLVEEALGLRQLGNEILIAVGGRAVHPINLRVGGFHRLPNPARLAALVDPLRRGLETAVRLTRFIAGLPFSDLTMAAIYVSLQHPDEYAIHEGRVVSDQGLALEVRRFEEYFVEEQQAHSHALHGRLRGASRPCLTGPLARYANNHRQLSPLARELAREAGLGDRVDNPFRSIVVRMVEVVFALEEGLRLLGELRQAQAAAIEVSPRAVRGCGATEAPRGLCYHRYDLDDEGRVTAACIVPPTALNQPSIEEDLRRVVADHLDLPDERLQWLCEQAIRNYDPCISCATHFLRVRVERAPQTSCPP
ncbi:MAG: Ni/Fe hydrogenase subunit alpha [Desulfobulbaceae bacterium A2]|nr:MAG: Ni/Fe hydrogenase subunit alpha [Desulfobulbaceae bacterium A2]